MKRYKLIILIFLISLEGYTQGITKITGNIPQMEDEHLVATMSIFDPTKLGKEGRVDYEAVINKGKFEFSFTIDKPSSVYLSINNKYAFMPGIYSVLIEPRDSISISIPEMKKAGYFGFGITTLQISGNGSEKLNFAKKMVAAISEIKTDIPWQKQSLTFKYEDANRQLDEIDSVYSTYKGEVSQTAKDILRAQMYDGVLDMLFISSTRNTSDSVRILFDKYILDKKRIEVFFKNEVIYYHGGSHVVPNYILLTEFSNPTLIGGESYRNKERLNFAKIILKHIDNNSIVRDYLLSNQVKAIIKEEFTSQDANALFKLYEERVDINNPFYNQIVSAYQYTQKNLKPGTPFLNFSLPDTAGTIHQLTDFNKKVLVIDFWFNGCVGCKQMVPVLNVLEKEFEHRDVQFISVNIDKKERWLDGIGKYSSKNSLQLYTDEQGSNHPLIRYLNLSTYPRLIVIDKNGNIVGTPPDPRSRKEDFEDFIIKLL